MPTLKQYNIINCYIYYTLALKMALDADRVLNLHSTQNIFIILIVMVSNFTSLKPQWTLYVTLNDALPHRTL